jgi:hypothetical protein
MVHVPEELTLLVAIPIKAPRGSRGLKECPFDLYHVGKGISEYLFMVLAENLTFVIVKN